MILGRVGWVSVPFYKFLFCPDAKMTQKCGLTGFASSRRSRKPTARQEASQDFARASFGLAKSGQGQRGHPFMTSAQFSDFLTPSPPCPRWATGLYYKIHATSLTLSAFPLPPPPLSVDVINGWPLMPSAFLKETDSRGQERVFTAKLLKLAGTNLFRP